MLIVGSHALIRAVGPVRRPVDVDMFATAGEARSFMEKQMNQGIAKEDNPSETKLILHGERGGIIEVDLTSDPVNKLIHDAMKCDFICDGLHASVNWQYFLKMSHRFKKNSKHFMKTMQDIHLLRTAGARMPVDSGDLFTLREKATYDYGHPNLMVGKEDFFKKEETFYKYDHDDIHKAVAVGDVPAYTHYMKDGAQVMTSREKFDKCLPHVKLLGVLEESYVLALERSLIPFDFKPDPRLAFNRALEGVCTSITSGYFREFAWENYFHVQKMYNPNYVDKFKKGLEEGVVKLFERT